ncbi:MAG: DUF4340 domain-containing protein [Treponema sp.]|jgi:hypothetical protein|nr:DUF4340 domain-containing protein [Treponema sp.]
MKYRQKLIFLSSLAAVLALVYVLTLVFDPQRSGRRSDLYTWLDSRLRDSVDRIDLMGSSAVRNQDSDEENRVTLLRRNGRWLVLRAGLEYPARQARIDELLNLLSQRDSYPRRSSSNYGLFGLSETQASRITLGGGAGLPLLDLLIGNAGGGGLYLRKANGGEVRSGGGDLITYIDGDAGFWYNLRLFPESEDGGIAPDSVQRLTLVPPGPASGETAGPVVITREQNNWRIDAGDRSLDPGALEKSRVDSYISGILNMTGDDFVPAPSFSEDVRISLELGDGRVLAVSLGPPEEDSGRRQALVLGSPGGAGPYGYALGPWALDRIFREPEFFKK